jgi:hypothetical protein
MLDGPQEISTTAESRTDSVRKMLLFICPSPKMDLPDVSIILNSVPAQELVQECVDELSWK